MITRYSLYRELTNWIGDIQEDPTGSWVKWKDIAPYLGYCEEHGFEPPQQLELNLSLNEQYIDPMVDEDDTIKIEVTEDDDHQLPLDDGEDTYELITQKDKVHLDDEVDS